MLRGFVALSQTLRCCCTRSQALTSHESVYGMMCARNLAFISMTKYSVDPASLFQAFVFQSHQGILRSSILESWVWSKEERVLDLGGLYRCPLELSGPGISCLIEGHDGGPSFARLRCGRRIKLLAALVCFYNRIDMSLKIKSAWNYLLACLPWSSCLQTFLLAAGLCGHLHHEPWRCLRSGQGSVKGGARSLLEGTTVRSEEGLRTFFQIFFHMSQEIKKQKKHCLCLPFFWAILAK